LVSPSCSFISSFPLVFALLGDAVDRWFFFFLLPVPIPFRKFFLFSCWFAIHHPITLWLISASLSPPVALSRTRFGLIPPSGASLQGVIVSGFGWRLFPGFFLLLSLCCSLFRWHLCANFLPKGRAPALTGWGLFFSFSPQQPKKF